MKGRTIIGTTALLLYLCGIAWYDLIPSYYLVGTKTFKDFCAAQRIDFDSYSLTRGRKEPGYSYLDYQRRDSDKFPIYHVIIPWIGPARVETFKIQPDLHDDSRSWPDNHWSPR